MKKFIALLLSILVIFSLTACGNSASSDDFTKGSDWIEVKSITYHLRGDTSGEDIYGAKIRFLSDGSIEIQNDDNSIIRILPLSYKITYLPS